MYCASCGTEIDDGTAYCPDCGHEIGTDPTDSVSKGEGEKVRVDSSSESEGVDYDFAMSIEDAIARRSIARWIVDITVSIFSFGIWIGFVAVEVLVHHRNLKKGDTEPWEEGDETEFWIHW